MKSWKSVLAVGLASLLVATSAMAQSTSPAPADSPGRTDAGASVATPSPAPGAGETTAQPTKPAAKRSRVSRERVTAVQQALKDRGHDPGEIDGALGPKTRAALREFQKKEGLKVTGRLDSATLARLGIGTTGTAAATTQPGMEVKPAAGEPSSATASPATTPAASPAATPPPGEARK
jgi:peptidoglycan hydrolase-like protein with peptidoglycan-binding domain